MGIDFFHLARILRRSPVSAVAAILTLSLTLGAGASIFAIIRAVLLTPPPFEDPGALVVVDEKPLRDPAGPGRRVDYVRFEAWRERAGSLAALEASEATNVTLTGLGAAERLSVTDVTPGFLTLLGVVPMLGRGFDRDDVNSPVAIVSSGFWRGTLAGDPNVLGRQIVLGSRPHTIVGVLPASFVFELNPADVWRPLNVTAERVRAGLPVRVVARLAPNVSPAQLSAALEDVSRRATPPASAAAVPIATAISGSATRPLGVLAGAAALAVVIAFTNFAGLLLVRSIDRRRELAIRQALGARRSETLKQLLLEAQALVAIGTAGGVLLALAATPVVASLVLAQFGAIALREVAVSWQVIVLMAVAASACACICAWLPSRTASRRAVLDVLRRGMTPPPGELLSRRVLVSAQIALAFVLLVCVTLVGDSLFRLLRIDPGFDAQNLIALQVSLPRADYPDERASVFYSALQGALDGRLEPRSIAIVNEMPLTGDGGRSLAAERPSETGQEAVVRETGPAYFGVMRIPIAAGRSFDARDDASAPLRAVISELMAQQLFARQQPIGRQIWLAARAQMAEVIGVVGDVKHRALDEVPLPTIYLSTLQAPSLSRIVLVRSTRPYQAVVAAVREEVARLDGSVPVYRVRSMGDIIARSPGVPVRRVLTATFVGFAVLALVLGALGLFGVVAHDVASRRVELALRMALGADPTRILNGVLRQGAVMLGWGLTIGGVLSIWATRALSSAGIGTGRVDALSVGLPAVVLVAAGTMAAFPAAWRAARTDPQAVLRSE